MSVVVPATSVSSRTKWKAFCSPTTCEVSEMRRGGSHSWIVKVSGFDVVALGVHAEQDRARGRVAGPGADPAFEPVGLGDRRPHGLDRGPERAVDDDAVVTVAGLSAAGGLGGHAVSSTGSDVVASRWSRTVRRTSRSRPSSTDSSNRGRGLRSSEQAADRVQPAGHQRVVAFPPVRLGADQAGVDEHAQVLADGRAADRVPGGEVDHARRAPREGAQELASHRVGERGERVHGSLVTNGLPICQDEGGPPSGRPPSSCWCVERQRMLRRRPRLPETAATPIAASTTWNSSSIQSTPAVSWTPTRLAR